MFERKVCFYPKVRAFALNIFFWSDVSRRLVNWLKYQLTRHLHHERRSAMLNKLQEIDSKLINHRHPIHRQQFHETKHLWKSIADDLRQIAQMIQQSR